MITIQDIDTAKVNHQYRRAGQLDALRGGDGFYGCHFGMRSTRNEAIREYQAGFEEVSFLLRHGDQKCPALGIF